MLSLGPHPVLTGNALLHHKYQSFVSETVQAAETSSSGEESATLPCLPKSTVVLITGNNRTKKSLVGQQAVIKRAVGLGGWHHCVLQDGSEVKLQRNALSVLEMGPPETVDDPSGSSSDTEAREPRIELLTQPRARRPPKALFYAPDMPAWRRAAANNSSGLHSTTYSLVDLHKLETTSLKRYKRVYQLGEVDATTPKADLVTAVQQHFTTQVVEEDQVLLQLVVTLRRRYKQQQLLSQQQNSDFTYSNASEQGHFHTAQQQQQQQQQPVDGETEHSDAHLQRGKLQLLAGLGLAEQQQQPLQLLQALQAFAGDDVGQQQLFLLQQQQHIQQYRGPSLFQEPQAM